MIEQIRQVKARYQTQLLKLANVEGVGVGFKQINRQITDQLALIVNVSRKVPLTQLAPDDVVPPHIDGVATDVQEMGHFTPL